MPSTANQQAQRRPTMITTRLLTLSLVWSSCQATGLRGPAAAQDGAARQLNLLSDVTTNVDCSKELRFDILCQGDCNFTAQEGTCESKMFQYHGGPCRSATAARSNSDSAANCQDLHNGPPTVPGQDVFVVIADAVDPSKNSSMWTKVGGFFWTDYRDYPIGLGLSDQQNITVYASNETSFDNMLQTMLFYAPCEGTPLEHLARDQSVQLFATAVDTKIRAYFEFQIQSQTQQQWQLQSVTVASSGEPAYQELIVSDLLQTTVVGNASVPLAVEMNRNDTLTLLSSAKLVTASGLECTVPGFYVSSKSTTTVSSRSWP